MNQREWLDECYDTGYNLYENGISLGFYLDFLFAPSEALARDAFAKGWNQADTDFWADAA